MVSAVLVELTQCTHTGLKREITGIQRLPIANIING